MDTHIHTHLFFSSCHLLYKAQAYFLLFSCTFPWSSYCKFWPQTASNWWFKLILWSSKVFLYNFNHQRARVLLGHCWYPLHCNAVLWRLSLFHPLIPDTLFPFLQVRFLLMAKGPKSRPMQAILHASESLFVGYGSTVRVWHHLQGHHCLFFSKLPPFVNLLLLLWAFQ